MSDLEREAEDVCRRVCEAVGAYQNIRSTRIVAEAMRAAALAERARLTALLLDTIAACTHDIATGHLPSSFDPHARIQECQGLLAILREGTT